MTFVELPEKSRPTRSLQRVIDTLGNLPNNEWLTTPELAKLLGVTIGTLGLYSGDRRLFKFKRYVGGGKTLAWFNGRNWVNGHNLFIQKKKLKKVTHWSPRHVTGALRTLGVHFKSSPGKGGFWNNNGKDLDWIYADAKKAYRAMVKKCHPDVGGSHADIRDITNAWSLIRRQFKIRYPEITKP